MMWMGLIVCLYSWMLNKIYLDSEDYPMKDLIDILCLEDENEAISICIFYNIKFKEPKLPHFTYVFYGLMGYNIFYLELV